MFGCLQRHSDKLCRMLACTRDTKLYTILRVWDAHREPRVTKSQAKHPSFLLRTSASARQMPRLPFIEIAVGILVCHLGVVFQQQWDSGL